MIKTGILLSGGSGTRLYPLTGPAGSNKHMLPVHNKFIIDYSIGTLISSGCENISVVLGGAHHEQVLKYLSLNYKNINLNFLFQNEPLGIAHGINLCANFIKDNNFMVMLGDNIFDNKINFSEDNNAEVLLCKKDDMTRFGVASIKDNKIEKMEEKPKILDDNYDNYAITGCYKFNQKFFEYYKDLKPSSRGEYEVVEIIKRYKEENLLGYSIYNSLWSDAGLFDSINFLNNYFYYKNKTG